MQPLAPAPPHSAQQEMHSDNDLRAQLAAVINTPPNQQQQQQQLQSQQQQQPHLPHLQPLQPMSQQQHMPHGYGDSAQNSAAQNIDPAIAGQAHAHHALDMMGGGGSAGGDSGDDNTDGRKGAKRELSQSKRAAQNRAAQRAFRQRKEGYIKTLESKVRDLNTLEDNFKMVQNENYALRDYILQLQRRLLESQNEFPQPPPIINAMLNSRDQSHDAMQKQHQSLAQGMQQAPMSMAPTATMSQQQQASMGQDQTRQMQEQLAGGVPMNDLQARAAAAVVDFKESVEKRRQEHEEYMARNSYKQGEDRNPEEELTRQLQNAAQDGQGVMPSMQGL